MRLVRDLRFELLEGLLLGRSGPGEVAGAVERDGQRVEDGQVLRLGQLVGAAGGLERELRDARIGLLS